MLRQNGHQRVSPRNVDWLRQAIGVSACVCVLCHRPKYHCQCDPRLTRTLATLAAASLESAVAVADGRAEALPAWWVNECMAYVQCLLHWKGWGESVIRIISMRVLVVREQHRPATRLPISIPSIHHPLSIRPLAPQSVSPSVQFCPDLVRNQTRLLFKPSSSSD